MRILVIDVGGSNIKVLGPGRRKPIKIPSGRTTTAAQMVRAVKQATAGWSYDVVTIGYPGVVKDNHPIANPVNLGTGWVRFDYRRAFGRPVRVINDAAMQALGSYRGGRMLYMGLGTGLGTAVIIDGALVPLEVQHLPYQDGHDYEGFVGQAGLERLGRKRWARHVAHVVALFTATMCVDYVVLGGGNVKKLGHLPPKCVAGGNAKAFVGGRRIWRSTRSRPGARPAIR